MRKKRLIKMGLLSLAATVVAACGNEAQETVKVGVMGDATAEVWKDVAARLEEKSDITIEVITFTDYVQPNIALAEGELDLNAFQHSAFLSDYVIDSSPCLFSHGNDGTD